MRRSDRSCAQRAATIKERKGLTAREAAEIADLFATKGTLLRTHRDDAWPVKDVIAEGAKPSMPP